MKMTDSQSSTTSSEDSPPPAAREKYSSVLKFPPCVICGGRATGLHYGSNTCEACKNFFRRCLTRKTSYTCRKDNNCVIVHTGRICPACRWEKCLQNGMSKDKCRMGRYTSERRTNAIKVVQHLEKGNIRGNEITLVKNGSCRPVGNRNGYLNGNMILNECVFFTFDDTRLNCDTDTVDMLVDQMENMNIWGEGYTTKEARYARIVSYSEQYRLKVETFGQMNDISMDQYQTLLRNHGIDLDGQWELFKKATHEANDTVTKYLTFVRNIPGFNRLSASDQSKLLKITQLEFFTVLMHEAYNMEHRVLIDANGLVCHLEEVADKFISRQLVMDCYKVCATIQALELTDTEIALLVAMAIMSSDRCDLEKPELVDRVQECLANLLLQDLHRRLSYRAAVIRFSKFIDMLVRLRDISKAYFKEYRLLCHDEFILQSCPDIVNYLPEEDC